MLIQEYTTEPPLDRHCIVELHSGAFLEYANNEILSTYTCTGRFSFKNITIGTIEPGFFTLQNTSSNNYLHIDCKTDSLSFDQNISIWRFFDA